jgi:hypothetical protein
MIMADGFIRFICRWLIGGHEKFGGRGMTDHSWQVELTEMTISGLFMALCHGTQKDKIHWVRDVSGRYHLEWEDMLIMVGCDDRGFNELQVSSGRLMAAFKSADISPGNKALRDYAANLVRLIQQDTFSTDHGLEKRIKKFISETIE